MSLNRGDVAIAELKKQLLSRENAVAEQKKQLSALQSELAKAEQGKKVGAAERKQLEAEADC